ncbi:glutathione S-transferase family protein [Leptolyngbya boryana NIES-2135]|jgi:glutathione S-transferase|uniref:Glutathione S-transferase family protein n=1 Tax=Leptolyngbya boryana NIES-2135 TaxID=1973484 RepID=A0A1Z4JQ59_LEPBY|nr:MULTISPECIES: glutathione S-transferase N-terminal domain-containing protein [Leptolyngbya]BAY58850.1 glutathione S-transferase family protein [Leptolyngbya boryana NIES-2135]MBD2370562.1 glutathione S-transferase N-terminal domain-containing protein [Leptolyngbya sp. FACHB-161]MBD2376986.1 glutathione S-transferase N-terminal domain-containing protein [Leptolyngbya sp. FACHB-238]MBD2401353.1 glutathione S-transferase N-terminal domain-containing protein [Leptolyngbya sp. FACHB-239]MBD24079
MKLYLNTTSPFARWVLVCALEYAVPDLELIWVNPWDTPETLTRVNPFSTVPVLQMNQTEALYESSIIVRYLIPASIAQSPSLQELQRLALGKMLLETAFRHTSLKRYAPAGLPPHPLIEQTERGLTRVLQTLSVQDLPSFSAQQRPDVASLQIAIALDYISFRCPDLFVSSVAQSLQEQLHAYQLRPSFEFTTPSALAAQSASIPLDESSCS